MKDVVRVSISGIAFTFEQDAYDIMKEYISSLEAGYAKNPDGREIVADIEARIAELILNEQESDKIVSTDLVQSVISQLGFPDDLSSETETTTERLPKRLFRNRDGAVLGGVCSGLGTYFRVDAVWIRLVFFLPLLLSVFSSLSFVPFLNGSNFFGSIFGMFILLYIVMWISVPMARTPRQKLEMRGERITASSIRHTFEEDASADASSRRHKSASVWADVVYGLGRILQFILKAIVFIIAMSVGVCAVVVLISLIALMFTGDIIGGWHLLGAFDGLVGITPVIYVALFGVTALIPMFVICYFLLKLLFNSKVNRNFMIILAVIWVALVIYLSVMTTYNRQTLIDGVQQITYSDLEFDEDGTVVVKGMNFDMIVDDDGNVTYQEKSGDEYKGKVNLNSVVIAEAYAEYFDDLDDENVKLSITALPSGDSLRVTKVVLDPANMTDTMKVNSVVVSKETVEIVKKMPQARRILKKINFKNF